MASQKMNREEALRVLGLKPSATPEDIKRAFHRLAAEYHPDKHASAPLAERQAAELRMQQINEARRILTEEPKPPSFVDMLKRMNPDFNSAKSTVKPQKPQKHATRTRSTVKQRLDIEIKEAGDKERPYLVALGNLCKKQCLSYPQEGLLSAAKEIAAISGPDAKKLHILEQFLPALFHDSKFELQSIVLLVDALLKESGRDSTERFKYTLNILTTFGIYEESKISDFADAYHTLSHYIDEAIPKIEQYGVFLKRIGVHVGMADVRGILSGTLRIARDFDVVCQLDAAEVKKIVPKGLDASKFLTILPELLNPGEKTQLAKEIAEIFTNHYGKGFDSLKPYIISDALLFQGDLQAFRALAIALHKTKPFHGGLLEAYRAIAELQKLAEEQKIPHEAIIEFFKNAMHRCNISIADATSLASVFFNNAVSFGKDAVLAASQFSLFINQKSIQNKRFHRSFLSTKRKLKSREVASEGVLTMIDLFWKVFDRT